MKKFLSMVLTVSMLLGLIALPAKAVDIITITELDTVKLEFEDYIADLKGADGSTVGGASWVISNSLLSGGKAICTGAGPLQEVSLTIPIQVEDAGTYDVETAVTYAAHLSTLVLYLDDTEVKTFNSAGTALPHAEGSYYFGGKDYQGYKYTFRMELPEGSHNLKLLAKQRAANYNGGTVAFGADYMTLKNINAPLDAVTVTGIDTTKLEYEDYATNILGADGSKVGGTGWVLSHNLLSNSKGLRTGSGPKQDISLTIPIDVKIGGTFEVETVVSYASWLSTLTLFVDNVEVKKFDGSGTALPMTEGNNYFNSTDFPGYKYNFDVELPSGRHELKLHVKQRAENFNGGDTAFAADYIRLKNKDAITPVEISSESENLIEAENYRANILSGGEGYADAEVTEHEKASGGAVLEITEVAIPETTVIVPIQVTKTGVYDLHTIMSKTTDGWKSVVTMTVDGEMILENRNYSREDLSDSESETPFINSTYPMYNFPARLALTEGAHTIEYTAAPAAQDGKVKFMLDCLKITPAEALTLSADETTSLEFEDYVDYFNTMWKPSHGKDATGTNTASEGDYAYSFGAGTNDAYLYMPIHVSETGLYDVEYVVAAAGHLSPVRLHLDATPDPFHTNRSGGTSLGSEEESYFHSQADIPATKYEFPLYLTEGDHYIKFHIPTRPAGDIMSVAFALDYMRFTKADGVFVDSENGAIIEMEDYQHRVLASGNVIGDGTTYTDMQYNATVETSDAIKQYASGGAILNMSERTNLSHSKIHIPVTTDTDGWYHVDWTITNASEGAHLSLTTLQLDGKSLVTNNGASLAEDVSVYEEGYEGNSANVIYPSKWYPMGRYEAQIHLTAGDHIFTLDSQQIKTFTDGNYGVKFRTDAIKLTPIHGVLGSGASFTESADHTGATWNFDMVAAGVEGSLTGYIASYSGNKLISVKEEILNYVSGENSFSGTVAAELGVDKMKFFVWDENQKPIANTDEVPFMPITEDPFAGDNEINVVFIGDSIYEGAGSSGVDARWVSRVGKWFEDTYEKNGVTVNWYNEGVGGTTTDYSLVRMFRDVIEHDPDVVFYSCSCNDIGDTRRNMESFLLSLMELDHVPYVIFNRTTNRSFSTTNGRGNQIAAHYNIPFVDDYDAFKRAVAESGKEIATFFTGDGVHPNDSGYEVIANEMIACVSSGRYYRKPVSDGTKIIANSVIMESATFIPTTSSQVTKTGSWTTGGSGERTWVRTNKIGDTLEFDFTGNFLAFEHGLHQKSGKYEVYVDGELAMTCNPYYNGITSYQLVCKNDTINLDLPDGDHHVVVKTIESSSTTEAEYTVHIYNIIAGNVKR